MNDGIMYTFDVVSSDVGTVMFRCARQETAEYLRDWCEAVEYNKFLDACVVLKNRGISNTIVDRLVTGLDKYTVEESEVIL